MSSSPETLEYLKKRLQDSIDAREDYPEGSPTVTYCVDCDGITVGELPPCDVEHTRVSQGWENGGISAWLTCLKYVESNELVVDPRK